MAEVPSGVIVGEGLQCIDADVHPTIERPLEAARERMPASWRQRFQTVRLPQTTFDRPGGERTVTRPADLLAAIGAGGELEAAVLISLDQARAAYLPGPTDTAVLMAAFNDLLAEEWLVDGRLRLSIGVSPQAPERSAAEIRRWAGDARVCAVFLPLADILMGDAHYHPIYAAATEAGLPILIHPTIGEGQFQRGPSLAGGVPSTYVHRHAILPQVAQTNVISLIFEGVFERFPELKVIFAEYGFAWLPHVMWRGDKNWRGLRPQVPWVKRSPIEYVQKHIRVTGQPGESPSDPAWLGQMLEMIYADRTLLYASDFPNVDAGAAREAVAGLEPGLRRRVLIDNAKEALRL